MANKKTTKRRIELMKAYIEEQERIIFGIVSVGEDGNYGNGRHGLSEFEGVTGQRRTIGMR
jgi:hypothetical protein